MPIGKLPLRRESWPNFNGFTFAGGQPCVANTSPPPATRLTLVELERREVVSETLSFLAAGLIADGFGSAAAGDSSVQVAQATTSPVADSPAAPPLTDLLAPLVGQGDNADQPPAAPPPATEQHAAADSSTAFGPFVGVFGDSDTPAPPTRTVEPTPDHAPPHGGTGSPASGASAVGRPAPVSPPSTGTGSPARNDMAVPNTHPTPQPMAPRSPNATDRSPMSGISPQSSGGQMTLMDEEGGDVVATSTDLLIAPIDQEIEVTTTVTLVDDHFQWQYDVTNLSYVGTGEDPSDMNVARFVIDSGVTQVTDVADTANSLGWINHPDLPTWVTNDKNNLLAPGASGNFTFTTPMCAVGHVNAQAGQGDYLLYADGQVLGPVPNFLTANVDTYIPVNANNDNYNPNDLEEARWSWEGGRVNAS
jgi:hypothetical protein